MVENYKIITITHKSAELKDIGKFVLPESSDHPVQSLLQLLQEKLAITELFYLPTCNRVMYFFCYQNKIDQSFLAQFTETLYPSLAFSFAKDKFIVHEGEKAIRHLFEVASSIDSLVVGEHEIIRQLRDAYTKCNQEQLTGDSIRLAMDTTVRTSKQIHANTKIGEKQVSVVSLAMKKLLEAGIHKDHKVLIIGAGQTNHLICKFLKKYEFTNITIFNRTLDKAKELADFIDGQYFPLSHLEDYKNGFDSIIVCTGSTEPVITHTVYKNLLGLDTNQKTILDLAIPNNVSKDVLKTFDINYIEIDGLKLLASENMSFRAKEVDKAKQIIENSLDEFETLYAERQLEKALKDMPIQIKKVKTKALNEVFKKEVDHLDDDTRDLLERMLTYMEKKCISIPMKVAKETILP